MKKNLLLGLLVGLMVLVTGCGNTKEANVAETEMETVTVCEETTDDLNGWVDDVYVSEEEFEEGMRNIVSSVEETYIEAGMSEECKDEIIEMINSIKYDSSYVYGFDMDEMIYDYLRIIMEHDVLPEEYKDYTIEELYELVIYGVYVM